MNENELNLRQEFGTFLKTILKRNGIRVGEAAKAITVTQGYLSQVIAGVTLLSEERFMALSDYLEKNIADADDVNRLTIQYYNARVGKDVVKSVDEIKATTVQRHFLQLLDQLTSDQQMQVLNVMLQYIEENKFKMAKNAGIEPD